MHIRPDRRKEDRNLVGSVLGRTIMSNKIYTGKLEELIPKSIDEIIRKNRDKLCLELVNRDELTLIHRDLPITNFKGSLSGVCIYRRRILINGLSSIAAVGWVENRLRHTSSIVAYDPKTNVILTHSGSHYVINDFIEGEPDFSILTFICVMLHHEGVGDYFGVPPFFY
jgi:hypothetical protein